MRRRSRGPRPRDDAAIGSGSFATNSSVKIYRSLRLLEHQFTGLRCNWQPGAQCRGWAVQFMSSRGNQIDRQAPPAGLLQAVSRPPCSLRISEAR